MYTVVKFILNNKFDPNNPNSFPLISRTLGKIVLPDRHCPLLKADLHNNTFWAVKLLAETYTSHKGVLVCEPMFQVETTSLLPGMFTHEVKDHWVFLNLKDGAPSKAFAVPKSIKMKYLNDQENGYSIVVVPYTEEQILSFQPKGVVVEAQNNSQF